MPVTFAPLRAIDSDSTPPPQPMSITFLPASGARALIHSRRSGLISWSGRNSEVGSHQRWASSLNFEISRGSAFVVIGRNNSGKYLAARYKMRGMKKTPPQRGLITASSEAGGLEITAGGYGYRPLRSRRGGSSRGQPSSCCRRPAASRPCLRCRCGLHRRPCLAGRP